MLRLSKIFLFFLAFPHLATCGGFSSWWRITPGGNTICNEKGRNEYIKGIECAIREVSLTHDYYHAIIYLQKWYFYRNHIVGEYWANGEIKHFIFNESTCEYLTFTDEEAFRIQKSEMGLEPKIWTRSYSTYWGEIIGEGGFTGFFDKLPVRLLILCFSVFTLIQLIRTRFSPKNRTNQVLLFLSALIAVRIWLDVYPQSF